MGVLLRLDALTATERPEYGVESDESPDYAIWFFLDRDQSCFVELNDETPNRQPEFYVRDSHHTLVVELFRKKPFSDERVLIGEAEVSIAFLISITDNHLIVEMKNARQSIVGTVLLRIERVDTRGYSLRPSPAPSSHSISIDELLPTISAEFPIGHSSSTGSLPAADSRSIGSGSGGTIGHRMEFLEKFHLRGSPVTVLKSEMTALTVEGTESISDSSIISRGIIDRAPSPSGVRGLASLEIVAAQNLPRQKRLLRVHYQNNPFVVISFGRQSFKTKVIKRTVNPVWKERLFFPINESEANYYITFSVYDYDKLSYNSCLGTTNIKASTLLERPNDIQKMALTLRLSTPNAFNDSCLLVKACFISYDVLRKNFWEVLAKQYDHDDNGKLNRIELTTMLECIGSTLSDETIDEILGKLDVDVEGEIAIDNIVRALEDLAVQTQHGEQHGEENIVLVQSCPVCSKNLLNGHPLDKDVITHLAICAAKDSGKMDRFVMGGFITEDYASRKWFMKLLSFMSFGGYRIGRNNGNILVQDRKTGKLLEERMPTYIRLGIRWMHQYSASSRAIDSSMVRQIFQTLTLKQGKKFDDPNSKKSIPEFIRYHKLNVDEIQDPLSSFSTFNEFFYRKLKVGARKLASPDPRVCVSPADCRLNCFVNIDEATQLWIKGANFNISSLLKDERLADYYTGGSLVICRLAPQDYHRFHSPVDGELSLYYHIPGTYFTVNPMAVRQRIDVYTENARTVVMIDSTHFGKVAFVAIGAMMVGSIVITATGGNSISRLDELGYFAFGGSTIVVLFPPGVISYDADLLANSREPLETLLQCGNSIGTALD